MRHILQDRHADAANSGLFLEDHYQFEPAGPPRPTHLKRRWRWLSLPTSVFSILLGLVWLEARTPWLQALLLPEYASSLPFTLEAGPSTQFVSPNMDLLISVWDTCACLSC
jgi:hypothetical protein